VAQRGPGRPHVLADGGMTPAAWPREDRLDTRLLYVEPCGSRVEDRRFADLPSLLSAGDLLVVNDAATLPASLEGSTEQGAVEVRLASEGATSSEWNAVLFGTGDWRQRTEDRPAPPALATGAVVDFAQGLSARIERVFGLSPRLVALRFDREGEDLWSALYRAGRPVQYSYLCGPLSLGQVQTVFGARPCSVEMASAGRPITAPLLRDLRSRGVEVASVTHAAGLSATGDSAVDAALPFPEAYEVPCATVEAIGRTWVTGGRVVAAGTTVVRALEGCAAAHGGEVRPGAGLTDLRIAAGFAPVVVEGLLTGLHEPGTSHFDLLHAFAPEPVLQAAHRHAESLGYLGHEFGDACLILGPARDRREATGAAQGRVKRVVS
jgi:S-adenosylmethionine:tRNA ribosyltransferase-isomerase